MEQWDLSVEYALQAGDLFDREMAATAPSAYATCIVGKAIDGYCQARQAGQPLPAGWEALVERILQRSLVAGQWSHALGLAIDARRLDAVEAILKGEGAKDASLGRLAFELGRELPPAFREPLLRLVVESQKDTALLADCLLALGAAGELGRLLGKAPRPVALQLAYDLTVNAPPAFRLRLLEGGSDLDPSIAAVLSGANTARLHLSFLHRANHSDMLVLERVGSSLNATSSLHHQAMAVCNGLMQAGTTNDGWLRTHQDWLKHANNWAKFTTVASIGLVHRGNHAHAMTVMGPYLPNLADLSKTAAAAAGGDEPSVACFAEAGALLALGLIHADQPAAAEVKAYLAPFLDCPLPTLQHGASLAVGIQSLGAADEALTEALKAILYSDDAVAGEGAALGLGLLWMGAMAAGDKREQAAALANELKQYAGETQHEKIIRALGLALALISFQSQSVEIPQSLLASTDPLMRYGGAWAMAMAFIATEESAAIRALLHSAVSDPSEDVRRAAVMALGPVMLRAPSDLLNLLRLLITSHSGQVRHGATMALAVAYACTGDKEAMALIKPLLNDSTDHVRQAAYLASATINQMQPEEKKKGEDKTPAPMDPTKKETRQMLLDAACAKGEDALARWGAIVGLGWLDAGGRNQKLGLLTPAALVSPMAAAGWLLSCQSWYWYPLALFGGLCLQPCGLIGVTEEEKPQIPQATLLQMTTNQSFAYPAPLKPPQQAAAKTLITAVLSTAGKHRGKTAAAAAKSNRMEIDPKEATVALEEEIKASAPLDMEIDQTTTTIENLQRLTPAQAKLVSWLPDARWQPLLPKSTSGIIILRDTQPGQPVEFIEQAEVKQQAPSLQPTTTTNKKDGKERKAKAAPVEEATPPAPFKLEE